MLMLVSSEYTEKIGLIFHKNLQRNYGAVSWVYNQETRRSGNRGELY